MTIQTKKELNRHENNVITPIHLYFFIKIMHYVIDNFIILALR